MMHKSAVISECGTYRYSLIRRKLKEMAEWLGREEWEIRVKLKELGLNKKSRKNFSVPVLSGAAINVILKAPKPEGYSRGQRPMLSRDILELIHRRRLNGETMVAVCDDLGVGHAAVYRAMQREGMETGCYKNIGNTKKAASAPSGRINEDIEDMIKRKAAGEDIQSIADHYGISRAAVHRRIQLHEEGGLEFSDDG